MAFTGNFISSKTAYNTLQIIEITNLSYPVLLLDKAFVGEGMAYGIKMFSANENYWQGHFAGNSVVPGTTMLEVMSQLFSVLILHGKGNKGERCVGYDKTRFYKEVKPGDKFEMFAEIVSDRMNIITGLLNGYVGDTLVCSTNITKVIFDKEK